jgi:hypothetical protein
MNTTDKQLFSINPGTQLYAMESSLMPVEIDLDGNITYRHPTLRALGMNTPNDLFAIDNLFRQGRELTKEMAEAVGLVKDLMRSPIGSTSSHIVNVPSSIGRISMHWISYRKKGGIVCLAHLM